LTPREEHVLRMRFGIGMNTDHTLEEVGQQFSPVVSSWCLSGRSRTSTGFTPIPKKRASLNRFAGLSQT
jgi:hypothetical protein